MEGLSPLEPPKVSGVLRSYFLSLEGVTQERLAEALGVSRHSVNELLNDRRSVTAPMALRLARALGTDPYFWMNLQIEYDLFRAKCELEEDLNEIEQLVPTPREDEFVRPFSEVFPRRKTAQDG